MGADFTSRVARRPKSYRGCRACKNARKKCSEAKPECAFCIRNGLQCEYDIDFVLRFETFVDGKQPRRRSSNKITTFEKHPRVRKLSGDSNGSDEGSSASCTPLSTPLPTPSTVCTELSETPVILDAEDNISALIHASPQQGATPEAQLLDQLARNSMGIFLQPIPHQVWEHDASDSIYMDYFRRRVKVVLPYFEVFPSMTDEIMCRATYDRGLQHTVLSVSHLIADARLHRSLVPAFQHQTQALSLLQKALSTTDITEALTISVAMLAWLNMARSNRPTLNQHLEGLYLIFQELFHRNQPLSPLMKQVWRFSLRLDLLATVLFFPRIPLFPPVLPDEERLNRDWVRASTSVDLTEWTLASFALDNLMHRASHLAMEVYESRKQMIPGQNYSSQVQKWIQPLLDEHADWLLRPIVQQAQAAERHVNTVKIEDGAQTFPAFLDYSPLQIRDKFYVNMLNNWRAIYIFIDLIARPQVGPIDAAHSKRFKFAVDICRTYASLGRDDMFPIGKTVSVFFAGIAFGGTRLSPEHTAWLDDNMMVFLQEYLPLNRNAVMEFRNVWEWEGDYWEAMETLNTKLLLDSMWGTYLGVSGI